MQTAPKSVLLLGASGTIGRATGLALLDAGHKVSAPVRSLDSIPPKLSGHALKIDINDAERRRWIIESGRFDAVISCLASRTGAPGDAWAIDHALNSAVLKDAQAAGIGHFVLLSAICVQKPKLAFQHAKLAFEAELRSSDLVWSIVRPTAYFKSLSGQIDRLRAGKPFLLFGNGELTACKPISDADLARYMTLCLTNPALQNRILPIGGPGPAITPRAQGEMLFDALGLKPRFKRVPVALMSTIITGLSLAGSISPRLRAKAELAHIGRYYATESMLVWDEQTGRYNADATPEFGADTLAAHFLRLATEEIADDRGSHAVF
ncbi:MAG: NAD(P)H-binding protein [Silicimonas sp.]|nr:NAD(P)H-binding protein [Silicimonas sp.]